jgi:hypothetical protein
MELAPEIQKAFLTPEFMVEVEKPVASRPTNQEWTQRVAADELECEFKYCSKDCECEICS